jgi:cell division protein FtsW
MSTKENSTVKKGLWNLIDRIEGDKVVWVIVFMLLMISWLAIFSSTPLLALEMHTDRISIMKEQMIITLLGLGVLLLFFSIRKVGFLHWFSQWGFLGSVLLLLILISKKDFGFIEVEVRNEAVRNLSVFGMQIHVYEIVKVAMVMYLSWAIHEIKCDERNPGGNNGKYLGLAYTLIDKGLTFLAKPFWKKVLYLYLPILIVSGMVMVGSNSSAVIIGGVLLATLMIGGLNMKEVWLAIGFVAVVGALAFSIHKFSGGTVLKRMATLESRIMANNDPAQLEDPELKKDKEAFRKRLGKIHQPNAAKIAVYEGGLLGKGPGGSTQKYVVPVMFGDYMFSFLLEEYGLWGGIIIILLYVSLLARGSWIARLCETDYAKTVVGGLSLLITGQAFLHMYINVDLGPLTGQTLPLVSHGNSSFLSFCVAFGVILSISRMADKKIRQEEAAAEPIYKTDEQENQ